MGCMGGGEGGTGVHMGGGEGGKGEAGEAPGCTGAGALDSCGTNACAHAREPLRGAAALQAGLVLLLEV